MNNDVYLYKRQLIDDGYISEKFSEDNQLALYNYTNKCQYEKKWNHHTKNSRGHVYQVNPRRLVACTFPKFFNFSELAVSKQRNLLKKTNYRCYEKLDGSLGIIYFYDGKWNVNTRGSFSSEQALKARELLKKYDLTKINKDLTLLVEIIYPENQIIINYEGKEELVLLSAYYTSLKSEVEREQLEILSKDMKIPIVKEYELTFDKMFEFQKSQDLSIEGYVVRFENGERIKIKSKKYLDIARILMNLTPLSIWKSMVYGKVPQKHLEIIPEELQEDIQIIINDLENQYQLIRNKITEKYNQVKEKTRKEIGLLEIKYKPGVFCMLDNKLEKLDNYILKQIKPKSDNNE